MHYMCKCVFVFAPLLCALSRTLTPSFLLFLLLAVSFLQLLQLHKLEEEEGYKRPRERATFLAVSQCEKITERCVQWSRTAHTL